VTPRPERIETSGREEADRGAFLLLGLCRLLVVGAAAAAPAKQKPRAKFDPTCGATLAKQRTVDGTLGSVTIQGTPKRVVALEFSFVDFLSQIGVKPVGIADDNDAKRITKPVLDLVEGYTSVGTRAAPSLEILRDRRAHGQPPDLRVADVHPDPHRARGHCARDRTRHRLTV